MNWPMVGMKNPGHCGEAAINEGGSGAVGEGLIPQTQTWDRIVGLF